MLNNFEDVQKLGQSNMDATMRLLGEWNNGWQAIATELGDYTKRSFEDGAATLGKLMSVKSIDQAVEIQTSYSRRAYDGYMEQLSKLGGMYANFAKDAVEPVEQSIKKSK